ncbi:MAG: DMT family transporter, partial [Actinomycetota bacterium]|nr:DMT family transporter [Actinomycetota bacterium]
PKGILVASLAAVAFGTVAIFAKLAYREGAELLPLLATRFVVAGALLVAYHVAMRRRLWIGRRDVVRLMLLGALGYATESALFFLGLERAPAAVISLIFFTYPMWTALLAFATRRESYTHRTLVALLLGTGGVALIFSVRVESLAGPLFALAAAVAVAVYLLVAQVVVTRIDASVVATWTALGAAVAVAAGSVVSRSAIPQGALDEAVGLGPRARSRSCSSFGR